MPSGPVALPMSKDLMTFSSRKVSLKKKVFYHQYPKPSNPVSHRCGRFLPKSRQKPISAKILPGLRGFCQKVTRNLFLPSFCQVWQVFAEKLPETDFFQVWEVFAEKSAETYFCQVSDRSGRFPTLLTTQLPTPSPQTHPAPTPYHPHPSPTPYHPLAYSLSYSLTTHSLPHYPLSHSPIPSPATCLLCHHTLAYSSYPPHHPNHCLHLIQALSHWPHKW
jgi:hypothetical protein